MFRYRRVPTALAKLGGDRLGVSALGRHDQASCGVIVDGFDDDPFGVLHARERGWVEVSSSNRRCLDNWPARHGQSFLPRPPRTASCFGS